MFRPSRSLTTWLLWLAIALLPVRAWAVAAMPVAMGGAAAWTQVQGGVAIEVDVEPSQPATPCHGASQPGDDASAPQACSLCGVCHAAFAVWPSVQAALPALAPERPPSAFTQAVETAALAGPERPPRLLLA